MFKQKKKKLKSGKEDIIFYSLIMIWPVLQFLVFYVGVNFNSVLLAFRKYDIATNAVSWTFQNFKNAFDALTGPTLMIAIKNSILVYSLTLGISVSLGLLFSYYIYKNLPAASFFRVVLFMPSIIASIILVSMFQAFTTDALPALVKDLFGIVLESPLDNTRNFGMQFGTLMFYSIWVGFGPAVLMYSNKMATIDPSISEAAKLDGAKGLSEFFYVTLPLVFPTLSVFVITGTATLFTNQINLFSFYDQFAPEKVQTIGYYLFTEAKIKLKDAPGGYTELAAMGLLLTVVAVPLTLGVKALLEKIGPSED